MTDTTQYNSSGADDRGPGPLERHRHRAARGWTIDPSTILGYSVSFVMAAVGIAITAGYFVHEGVPGQFRITLGVIMMLMGLYRFVITRTRSIQLQREREEEDEE